ncbi:glycosyltransferase family protein [Arthrobacter sp. TMN-49]
MKPQILCISFSDINVDSRVLRQLAVLSGFGDVTTLSYGDQPKDATHHLEVDSALPSLPQTIPGVAKLALHRFKSVMLDAPAVKSALALATGKKYDLIVANEARALPLAHALAAESSPATPVWGDMHEWAPEERAHVLSWRLLVKPFMTYVCKEYLPRTEAVTAVNGSIGRLYDARFGCTSEVVRNAAPFKDLSPSPMQDGVVRMAHSGAAIPGRNLEGMITAAIELGEGYTFDLYLVKGRDGGKYWEQLKALAAGSDRVTFHDAVAPTELAATLNQYDVGIFSLPPQTTNHKLMLPNKFFDFVQARLAIVFSPSPETSALIEAHDLGAIAADYSTEALVDAVRSLTREDIAKHKLNAHAAAQLLSSQEDEEVEQALLTRVLAHHAS